MPAAVIGGVIAGAGAIGSAAIGSSAAGKAADASTQAANTAAAEQRAAREQAYTTLSPYVQAGIPATQQINALLGIGQDTPATPGTQDWTGYLTAYPDVANDYAATVSKWLFPTPESYAAWHYQNYGQNEGRTVPMTAGTPGVSAADKAGQAFDLFRKSTGYDFRFNQGMNALNSGYAGAGTIKSGAAIKGAVDYGQGMAQQEFGNYLNALGNQQNVGLSAGSALAGVGQNMANSLGAIYQQNGENQANAALAKGQAMTAPLNGLISGIFKYGVK